MENMYTKLCTTIQFRQNKTKEDNSMLGLGFFVITRHVYFLLRAQTSYFIQFAMKKYNSALHKTED